MSGPNRKGKLLDRVVSKASGLIIGRGIHDGWVSEEKVVFRLSANLSIPGQKSFYSSAQWSRVIRSFPRPSQVFPLYFSGFNRLLLRLIRFSIKATDTQLA